VSAAARHKLLHFPQVEKFEPLGLIQSPLELPQGQHLSQVEQRSRNRGNWDVLSYRPILLM
jgi:hypothetical protein